VNEQPDPIRQVRAVERVNLAANLGVILTLEDRACAELLALTREEQQALQERDMTGLMTVVRAKEGVRLRLRDLDSSRAALLARARQVLGLDEAPGSLGELLRFLLPAEAARLESVAQHIIAQAEEIAWINHANGLLLQASLTFAAAVLSRLSGSDPRGRLYDRAGHLRPADAGHLLLDQHI